MRYKKRISLEHVMCFRLIFLALYINHWFGGLIFLHCISIIGPVD